MSPKEKAVALLSGGLDSTVSLALGLQKYDIVLALTFNYGQRAYGKEIRASRLISEYYNINHRVVAIPWLSELLPEVLSTKRRNTESFLPADWQFVTEQPESFFEAKPVWVPNRNGLFINIAATYAEANDAPVILFGANAEEAEHFPDNTEEFRQRINASLEYATLNHVRVEAPVGTLDKTEIIDRAEALNVPLHLVWSCYTDADIQCGFCPSCYRLKKALSQSKLGVKYWDKIAFMR
jgi:7-cyano-7-deazaguanine synthase